MLIFNLVEHKRTSFEIAFSTIFMYSFDIDQLLLGIYHLFMKTKHSTIINQHSIMIPILKYLIVTIKSDYFVTVM